jgi:hypothetical protein
MEKQLIGQAQGSMTFLFGEVAEGQKMCGAGADQGNAR